MFWTVHFRNLRYTLLGKDGHLLFVLGSRKGAYATGVLSGLLSLLLCRGHGIVLRWFDVEGD